MSGMDCVKCGVPSFLSCTTVQNILVNRRCQCSDIFLCPHEGDSGYDVFISDFDSALQVDRGWEKLERTKLHGHPIKYSVHGTGGFRPPEVGEGRVVTTQSCVLCEYCSVLCAAVDLSVEVRLRTVLLLLGGSAEWLARGDSLSHRLEFSHSYRASTLKLVTPMRS